MKELEPDAEQRVKRRLVLDEVIKKEEITVTPEEVESLFRAYAQMGQNLSRTEGQIRALAESLLHEKAITRLVELATGPHLESNEEESSVEAQFIAPADAGEEEVAGTQEQEEPGVETQNIAPAEAEETGTTITNESTGDTSIEVQ